MLSVKQEGIKRVKIEKTNSTTEINMKALAEKKTEIEPEEGFSFRSFLQYGMPISYATPNDFILNDFIKNAEEDLQSLRSSYKYDCLTMDRDDAMFFANAIKGENYSFTVNGEVLMQKGITTIEETAKTYKSASVSKTLMDMIANSHQTNKPVRIDFGNDISAILRVNSEGKISAEFIPSDKIAEEYLKNNISYLQQAFEEKDIPYSELSYKQQNKNKRNSNSQKDKQEGDK